MRLRPVGRPHMEGGWEWVGMMFQATILAERAFAVDSGLHVLLMNPLQPASFLKICVA